MQGLRRAAEAAAEGERVEPEHVEGGERRGGDADRPQRAAVAAHPVRRPQDLVLREEAGEERDAGDREAAHQHGHVRPGQQLAQPAHLAQVLLAGERVDQRARAEEQERLEERVGEDVEDARAERADPAGQEHVAELAHGRVGEHALDVGLDEGDRGGEKRRRRADHRDHQHRVRSVRVDRRRAGDHVDPRGHHRGRVDQRRDGRRALHRVGQPDVERQLRALAGGACEEQETDQGEGAAPACLDRELRRGGHHAPEVERAERDEDQEHPDQEEGVAHAVDDERLLAGVARALFLEPEPDQQVGAQPHPLPAHEQHRVVPGQHQGEHREHEQVEVGHEARVAGVLAHVADRVDVDQEAHEGHEQHHHRRQRIEQIGPIDAEGRGALGLVDGGLGEPAGKPAVDGLDERVVGGRVRDQHRAQRDQEGQEHAAGGHQADERLRARPEHAHAEREIEHEADERQQGDQQEEGPHVTSCERQKPRGSYGTRRNSVKTSNWLISASVSGAALQQVDGVRQERRQRQKPAPHALRRAGQVDDQAAADEAGAAARERGERRVG